MIVELDTIYGKMWMPDNDKGQYEWFLRTGAYHEDNFIELVCDLLDAAPKGMAIDVGANFGAWSIPLSGHATSVIAYEPQKCVYDILLRNTERLPNVYAVNAAVGDIIGKIKVPQLDIEADGNFGGLSLLDPTHEQPIREFADVTILPLDTFSSLCADKVSFIKIDVEGFEINVLRGANKLIATHKPIIFLEANHPLTNTEELRGGLVAMGYAIDDHWPNFLAMPL